MCRWFLKIQLLLVIGAASISMHSANGDNMWYVTPSQGVQSQNCESAIPLTLSMLAANTSDLLDGNTMLIFLEGNHTLESDIILTNIDNLMIQTTNFSVTACITCSRGVNLKFINIIQLKISGLEFIRCSSTIELVDQFTLIDSSFVGSSNSSALQLILTNTNIVRSSFTSSTLGSLSNLIIPVYTFHSDRLILDLSCHSYTARAGGALTITSSNVEISYSHFDSNEAEVGGAIYSQTGSNITINNSTFVNNKASCSNKPCSGGALFIGIGCTARACNTTFLNNTSEYSGGAIALLQGNLFGYKNLFSGNQAQRLGGGILAANLSTIELVKSNFSNSTTDANGGALFIERGLVTINSSSFDRNLANVQGGVASVSLSNFTVYNSSFGNNKASEKGGVVCASDNSSIIVYNSSFDNNEASSGGDIRAFNSSITVHNSFFNNNEAESGGVVYTFFSSIIMHNSSFENNKASIGGVMRALNSSIITVHNRFFYNNAEESGGVVYTLSCIITVHNSSFENNKASYGGVVRALDSSIITMHNRFTDNNAKESGGVVYTSSSSITMHNNFFENNKASYGGVVRALDSSIIIVHNSSFDNNEAHSGGVVVTLNSNITVYNSFFKNNEAMINYGGVVDVTSSIITVHNSCFKNNEASQSGGVVRASSSSTITVYHSFFKTNEANEWGGVVLALDSSTITMYYCSFTNNEADYGGVVYTISESSITVHNSSFDDNEAHIDGGVVYIKNNNNITVYRSFFNNNKAGSNGGVVHAISSSVCLHTRNFSSNIQMTENRAKENGGAIYLSKDSLLFLSGNSVIFGNQANNGGAIYANESSLILEAGSQTVIDANIANSNGGGWYLTMSKLNVKGNSTIITRNRANRTGGGLYADNSSIILEGTVYFINNTADNGAGIGLKKYAILKGVSAKNVSIINLTSNRASRYGGALYVDNEAIADTCAAVNVQEVKSNNHCFSKLVFFNFSDNAAGESGSNLFGGHLDTCKVIGQNQGENTSVSSGLVSFLKASNVRDSQLDTISSYPVQLCFCRGGHPDCDYQPNTIEVNHKALFSLQVIAYDQVHRPIKSTIYSSLNSSTGGLTTIQEIQKIDEHCTMVNFSLSSFSLLSHVELKLSVGPCNNINVSGNSKRKIITDSIACKCPIGFQMSINAMSCNCICAHVLQSYVRTQCNSTTETIIRKDSFWITYTNYTNSSGYVIHRYCPYDYCNPPTENVHINLNIPNGADTQCASNRSGTLCGSCKPGFSVSLGSSACLHCPPYWPGLLVTIIIIFILLGIGLVALILVLNLTVAIGTLNAIIFYANMVAANKSALFTTSKVSFASVFISWLNFDLGFDTCFFNSMDTYTKIWLQLAFPAYIVLLVAVIIKLSYHFKFFGNLIGKKDPVATLATLILLSYTKLLQTVLTAFSSVTLVYPDNSKVSVWLPDATVGYLTGKHAVLFTAAILILLAGLIYTFLLFTWQWFLCCPRKRVKRITNQKLNSFFEKYHIPYAPKHRYWTGLLLQVRVLVYFVSAFNPSGDPKITLISTAVIMACLYLYMTMFSVRLYKTWLTNTSEIIAYFNITAASITTLYMFDSEKRKQILITNISVAVTFIQLLFIVCCHIFRFANLKLYTKISNIPFLKKVIKRLTSHKKGNVHFKCAPLPADNDIHQFYELLDMIDRPVNTNDYKIPPQVLNKDKPAEPTQSVVEPPKPILEQPPPQPEEMKEEEKQEQQLRRKKSKKGPGHSVTGTDKVASKNDASELEISECDVCLSDSVVEPPKPYIDPLTPLEKTDEKIKQEQTSNEKDGIMKAEENYTTSTNEQNQPSDIKSYSGIDVSLCYADIYPSSSSEIETDCEVSNNTQKLHDGDKIEVIVEVHMDSQTAKNNIEATAADLNQSPGSSATSTK